MRDEPERAEVRSDAEGHALVVGATALDLFDGEESARGFEAADREQSGDQHQ